MKSILVPLYWLWCGASVFILVRRRVKKGSNPSPVEARAGDPKGTPERAPVDTEPLPAVAGGTPPLSAPVPVPEPTAAATGSPAAPPAAAPADHRDALSHGVPPSRVGTLAEALEGVRIPEGLAPLTGTGEFDPRALVLFTDGAPAEIVGTAMADELERLGFTLTPLDDQRLLALTDAATVEATVHPDPTVGDETGARRFPTAPDESVVLELRLR